MGLMRIQCGREDFKCNLTILSKHFAMMGLSATGRKSLRAKAAESAFSFGEVHTAYLVMFSVPKPVDLKVKYSQVPLVTCN